MPHGLAFQDTVPVTGRQPNGRCRGFTVVEALVALLVVATGVIGIAALYSEQGHVRQDAQLRHQAGELADAIAVRILATGDGREGYATTMGVVCNPARTPGLAIDVAAQEAACWEDEVEQKLPSGLGKIRRDVSTILVSYVISVSWSAPRQGAASYVIRVTPGTGEKIDPTHHGDVAALSGYHGAGLPGRTPGT